jgi:RecB family exonuclease
MLQILNAKDVHEKRKLLSELDSSRHCLLVSDLRAKFEWQNYYLEKNEIISEEFIFRPSDLWKNLARYLLPEFQIVSNDYILSYLSSYLQQKDEKFLKSPSSAQNLFAYISQLSVLMQHPEGRDLLKEWFKENLDSFHRWGHWFFVAEELWEHFLENKLLASSWVPSLLMGREEEIAKVWQRDLYVDLSLELKYVEAELFAGLSDLLDVHLVLPTIPDNKEFLLEFENYRPFFSKSVDSFESSLESQSPEQSKASILFTGRFTSALSEVKNAVASVRELLEQGIAAQDIAIVACDIGEYWPVLRAYLDKEGVASQRPYNTGVQSLLPVSRWLSEMKINSYRWQREDLEASLFKDSDLSISYEDFLRFYAKVYGVEDLARREEVFQRYKDQLKKNEKIPRDSFVIWALAQWKSKSYPSVLENIIKQLISEAPAGIKLYLKDWIDYLAKATAKAEICIRPGDPEGILCLDIISLDYVNCSHVLVLGMSEATFKKNSPLKAVSQSDILSLRAQTGFPLSPEESKSFEYYLLWNLYNRERSYYFSFAVTNFAGSISAPSLLWLKARKQEDRDTTAIDSPKESRLDNLQQQELESLEKINLGFSKEAIERDFGKQILSPTKLQRFSASGFREFVLCPFKFAAKYFYKLSSLPAIDLDVDRMKNGNLIHKLFELALQRKLKSTSKVEIANLVAECIESEKAELGEKALVSRYQKHYENILTRFLAFEENWKQDFPNTEYWKQEYVLDASWDKQSKKFVKKQEDLPRFKAIVDRIDKNESEYCIVDYKNSGASNKNFNQWFEEDDYQLLFYSKVLRESFNDEELRIMGAIYYSVKPMERTKGLVVKSADPSFLPTNDRKRTNKATEDQLLEAEQKLGELISDFQERVEAGELNPFPKKPQESCGDCDWKTICRAKHLN